jgi:hypothetical protein
MCRSESAGGVKPSPATNRDPDKVDAILVASQRSSSLCTMVEGHSYGIKPPRYCLQYGLNRTLVSRMYENDDDSLSTTPQFYLQVSAVSSAKPSLGKIRQSGVLTSISGYDRRLAGNSYHLHMHSLMLKRISRSVEPASLSDVSTADWCPGTHSKIKQYLNIPKFILILGEVSN